MEVRVPVPLAPTERVAVDDFVEVMVGLLVIDEDGVTAPEFVVVMVAEVVPVLVTEAV